MDQNTNKNTPVISEAIWVLALSAASYSIAYSYETGYAAYFNIPFNLIELSPNVLLHTIQVLLVVSLPLIILLRGVWLLIPAANQPIKRMLWRMCLGITFLFITLFPSLVGGGNWISFFKVAGLVVFIEVIAPTVAHWKMKSFTKIVVEQERIDNSYPSLIDCLVNYFGLRIVLFSFSLLCVCFFSNSLGYQHAKQKREFPLVKGNINNLVIAQYNTTFVTHTYNEDTKTLVGYMKIMILGDGKEIEISLKDVGPLKIEQDIKGK